MKTRIFNFCIAFAFGSFVSIFNVGCPGSTMPMSKSKKDTSDSNPPSITKKEIKVPSIIKDSTSGSSKD